MANRPGQGRKPLPTNVLEMRGTARAGRARSDEAQPARNRIKPPRGLSLQVRKCWRELLSELDEAEIVTNLDVIALRMLAETYAQYIAGVTELGENRRVEVDDRGQSRVSGYVRSVEIMRKSLHAQLIEFGMTPSSRTRVRIDMLAEQAPDPFDGF